MMFFYAHIFQYLSPIPYIRCAMIWVRVINQQFHQATVFCLLMLCSLSPFQGILITVGFNLNRTFIAENFCENTDKPELLCFGICQLKKKMADAESSKQDELLEFINNSLQFQDRTSDLNRMQRNAFSLTTALVVERNVALPNPLLDQLFRPPVLLV